MKKSEHKKINIRRGIKHDIKSQNIENRRMTEIEYIQLKEDYLKALKTIDDGKLKVRKKNGKEVKEETEKWNRMKMSERDTRKKDT